MRKVAHPVSEVRRALCAWLCGLFETDEQIEQAMGLAKGMVHTWRGRDRGADWGFMKRWVDGREDMAEEVVPFAVEAQAVQRKVLKLAEGLIDRAQRALDGEEVEFAPGAKPTARDVEAALHHGRLAVDKTLQALAKLQDVDNSRRSLERDTANDVVRIIDRIVGLTPEQKAEAKPELSRWGVTWLLDVIGDYSDEGND